MADDQATLGSFTEDDAASDRDADAGSEAATDGTTATGSDEGRVEGTPDRDPVGDGDLVCPWCLAPAEEFVERGLTGTACGRCWAVLPVDAAWFRERDVVARRPMYTVGER